MKPVGLVTNGDCSGAEETHMRGMNRLLLDDLQRVLERSR
jgi:hypothetical protein